ncbi:hypothetical protein NJC38_02255 [Pseudomonas sp. 21LCFQ010]|uniref:phage collar protein n=1 Tax=Pseudomonas sp. 21LCFQ010 TaxID=2957506 RepID=UPI0020983746|nr:hypothetical protein [Pseudomonas sp. 21LCFQ010]MCO8160974.1 hypothetical protein [Pseudomonas sp. 21LCFQ010]
MIADLNILGLALGVIGTQELVWHQANGRRQNDQGQWITLYEPPKPVSGSLQAVDRTRYQALGLDLARRYCLFYGTVPLKGTERGESPDLLDFAGRRHEVVNDLDWIAQAGWQGVLVVDTGPVP